MCVNSLVNYDQRQLRDLQVDVQLISATEWQQAIKTRVKRKNKADYRHITSYNKSSVTARDHFLQQVIQRRYNKPHFPRINRNTADCSPLLKQSAMRHPVSMNAEHNFPIYLQIHKFTKILKSQCISRLTNELLVNKFVLPKIP